MTIQKCFMNVVGKGEDKVVTYWSEPNGKGRQVAKAHSGGGGKYYVKAWADDPDTIILTDAEINKINSKAFEFHMADTPLDKPKKVGKKTITHRKGLMHRMMDLHRSIRNKVLNLSSDKYGACLTEEKAAYLIDFSYRQHKETEAAILRALGKADAVGEEVITLG